MTKRVRRVNNQKKGSALITVMIIIMLLSILGTSLLMVSVMGYRQKLQLSGANKAFFYIADGAIEESLAEINEISFAAEATANNHINEVFSFSEDSIFEALKKGKLDGTFFWQVPNGYCFFYKN